MDQSKACSGMFPTKRERCSQEGKIFQRGRHAGWIKSTYERRVANRGRNKGGSLDDGKHPSKCKWLNLSILTNFILALIVLSSITKKGEIVMNMAPFMLFRVILVIE